MVKSMLMVGSFDSDWRQWLRVLEVADGITNLKLLQADNGTDIARIYMVGLLVAHTPRRYGAPLILVFS